MELGESSVDTIIREFYEETGILVEPVKLLNVYTNFETVFPNGDARRVFFRTIPSRTIKETYATE